MDTGVSDEQVEILLNDVLDIYGYDFTDYTKASIKRRINRVYSVDHFPSFAEFRHRVRSDIAYFNRFIEEITVNVTEMFRDPHFYLALQKEIFPILATYPFIRIWHAGCSTGEEVYSMAILLKEANLLHKSLLYATDINPAVVKKAATGIFPLSQMQQYSENYIAAGGQADFSSYYTAGYDHALFNEDFRKRMVFSTHNLVADSSFNLFQLILCRNVLIYFDKELQGKVFGLFNDSLEKLGFIALGSKETLKYTALNLKYKAVGKDRIWRKLN